MAADPRLASGPVIQSAINFSEGRRAEAIQHILASIRAVPEAVLADWSADPDHNRMVATILGGPAAIKAAAVAAARAAVEVIDLSTHTGVHPRLGAVDVIPVVPIREVSMDECVDLSHEIAKEIGGALELPVYFYGKSAPADRISDLPDLRRAGRGLLGSELFGGLTPDAGPHRVHPTAGVAMVGARGPLVAYNVNLGTGGVEIADTIARMIRRDRKTAPELKGVMSNGWWLESQGRAQVSMNVTRPNETPIPPIFDYVAAAARANGVDEVWSEVIGLIPKAALGGVVPDRIRWRDFSEKQILEYWVG